MSRYYMPRRLAALAAGVGTTVALTTIAGASPALAVTCATPGYASGASLQGVAQLSVWLTETGWPAHSSCGTKPTAKTITYTKTSSGAGLNEFGDNSGVLEPQEDKTAFESSTGIKDVEGQVLDWYVGADPPTSEQLGEAEAAAGAKALAQITIPVAQAPIAVLLSLPAGCKLAAGSELDLPNNALGQLWEGTNVPSGGDPGGIQSQGGYGAATWGAFLTQVGYSEITSGTPTAGQFLDSGGATGCGQALEPQVFSSVSGTVFDFKNYLKQTNRSEWATFANEFASWPSSAVVQTDPLSNGKGEQANSGNSNIAGNTAANPGSVGFANTADAAANGGFTAKATETTFGTGTGGKSTEHQILWAQIQNNGTSVSGASYEDPLLPATSIANCETSKLIPSDQGFPYSYTDSWFGVVPSDPNIANDAEPTDYPICALTFDLVWHHYSNTKLYGKTTLAEEVANTVKDVEEYITGQGQIDIQSHDYTRFPTPMAAHVAVAVAAIKK
jgi:hypothetical protein